MKRGNKARCNLSKKKGLKSIKRYWKILGPGLTTGAADDDPSGIATYSQMGAAKGNGLLWLSVFTFPLMGVVQEMCARIGLVTGTGLAANIKKHYTKNILYICTWLLVFANVLNIGADLSMMAGSMKLILPHIPFAAFVIFFALLSLSLQVFIPYKHYSKYLKYLTLVLFAYIITAFTIKINWGEVLQSAVFPVIEFTKSEIILIAAAFGTTISPYLFFWQTSQEVEEKIAQGDTSIKKRKKDLHPKDIKNMRIDVWSGILLSNLVMFFIIVVSAATLHTVGITNINSAAEAAGALRPLAGELAFLLFAVGVVGTGLLAIPVLAGSASYTVSESYGFKRYGMHERFSGAHFYYGVIILAMVVGIILNFVGFHPIKILIYSAVLNAIISPIFLFLIVKMSSNKKIMGRYVNGFKAKAFGFFVVGVMLLVSIVSLLYLLV